MAGKAYLNIYELVELFKTEHNVIWKPTFSSLKDGEKGPSMQEEKGRKNEEDRGQI